MDFVVKLVAPVPRESSAPSGAKAVLLLGFVFPQLLFEQEPYRKCIPSASWQVPREIIPDSGICLICCLLIPVNSHF